MIQGILLAAGASRRFGSNKLRHPLPDGTLIGVAAARNLVQAVPHVVAIVRPDDDKLPALLRAEGLETVVARNADDGLSASLVTGLRATAGADGWLIALADMPWIQPQTMHALLSMLESGADVVAPCYAGRRGHPVGFSRQLLPELLQLAGDQGAKALLHIYAGSIRYLHGDDPGVLQDVDTCSDVDWSASIKSMTERLHC